MLPHASLGRDGAVGARSQTWHPPTPRSPPSRQHAPCPWATARYVWLITAVPLITDASPAPTASEREGGGAGRGAARRGGHLGPPGAAIWGRGGEGGGQAPHPPPREPSEADPGGGSTAAPPVSGETPPSGPSWKRRGCGDPKGIPPRPSPPCRAFRPPPGGGEGRGPAPSRGTGLPPPGEGQRGEGSRWGGRHRGSAERGPRGAAPRAGQSQPPPRGYRVAPAVAAPAAARRRSAA